MPDLRTRLAGIALLLAALSGGGVEASAAPLFPPRVCDEQAALPVAAVTRPAAPAPSPVAARQPRPSPRPAPAKPGPGLRSLRVTATAYALRGRTASGAYTAPGTIAVDPRVIPMGTRLWVPGYGWGRALDTGGAVKGNFIDVWLPTNRACFGWGVRTVTILVEVPTATSARTRRCAALASRGSRGRSSRPAPASSPATSPASSPATSPAKGTTSP